MNVPEKTAVVRCEMVNRLEGLALVNDRVEQFRTERGLPPEVGYALTLAMEELVTNIIKYGYDDGDEHVIRIEIEDAADTAELRIEDDGHEFDPIQGPPPAFDRPLEDRPVGGLGLHLVKEMAHSMEYKRDNRRNKVKVIFQKKPSPQTEE